MFGTYQRLGVTVWASNRAVIKAARAKLQSSAKRHAMRTHRHGFYRVMLGYHRDAQALCRRFAI